jgi:DNA-binding NarL/FixJ family response regulator
LPANHLGPGVSDRRRAPIIVTTGRREEAFRARAQRADCAAFFWRPVIAETLLKTIESIAHGSDGCTKVQ